MPSYTDYFGFMFFFCGCLAGVNKKINIFSLLLIITIMIFLLKELMYIKIFQVHLGKHSVYLEMH